MTDDELRVGEWQPLRVVMTRTRPRRITRRAPDIVIGPGWITRRRDDRLNSIGGTNAGPDPVDSAMLVDTRTGWEIDVSSGLITTKSHERHVDAHAAHHARSSREVGIMAGTTGHRRSRDAIGPAAVVIRRIDRGAQLTIDLEIRTLSDEMHGRIQICGGDWGLYHRQDTAPVMARALLRPAAELARRGDRAASNHEFYIGARIGGRP